MNNYKQLKKKSKNIILILKNIFPFYKNILDTKSFYKDLNNFILMKLNKETQNDISNITIKELKNKIKDIKSIKTRLVLMSLAMLNYSIKKNKDFTKKDLIHFKDVINFMFKENKSKGEFTKKVIEISEEYFNNVIVNEITLSGDVGGGFSTANLPGDARHTPLFNIVKRRNNLFANQMKQIEKMMNGKHKFKYFEKKMKRKKSKPIFNQDTFTMVR